MRYGLTVVRVLALVVSMAISMGIFAAAARPASAQANYPWCSNFSDGAGVNCGFSSYELCMATARGSGGTCDKNDWYKGPSAAEPARRQARKSHGKNS